ncbi:MAG: hypothetical protein M0R51_08585, partial [Clostridia bacterium]|nr:hypothetical protein [Clostridia bacterium]
TVPEKYQQPTTPVDYGVGSGGTPAPSTAVETPFVNYAGSDDNYSGGTSAPVVTIPPVTIPEKYQQPTTPVDYGVGSGGTPAPSTAVETPFVNYAGSDDNYSGGTSAPVVTIPPVTIPEKYQQPTTPVDYTDINGGTPAPSVSKPVIVGSVAGIPDKYQSSNVVTYDKNTGGGLTPAILLPTQYQKTNNYVYADKTGGRLNNSPTVSGGITAKDTTKNKYVSPLAGINNFNNDAKLVGNPNVLNLSYEEGREIVDNADSSHIYYDAATGYGARAFNAQEQAGMVGDFDNPTYFTHGEGSEATPYMGIWYLGGTPLDTTDDTLRALYFNDDKESEFYAGVPVGETADFLGVEKYVTARGGGGKIDAEDALWSYSALHDLYKNDAGYSERELFFGTNRDEILGDNAEKGYIQPIVVATIPNDDINSVIDKTSFAIITNPVIAPPEYSGTLFTDVLTSFGKDVRAAIAPYRGNIITDTIFGFGEAIGQTADTLFLNPKGEFDFYMNPEKTGNIVLDSAVAGAEGALNALSLGMFSNVKNAARLWEYEQADGSGLDRLMSEITVGTAVLGTGSAVGLGTTALKTAGKQTGITAAKTFIGANKGQIFNTVNEGLALTTLTDKNVSSEDKLLTVGSSLVLGGAFGAGTKILGSGLTKTLSNVKFTKFIDDGSGIVTQQTSTLATKLNSPLITGDMVGGVLGAKVGKAFNVISPLTTPAVLPLTVMGGMYAGDVANRVSSSSDPLRTGINVYTMELLPMITGGKVGYSAATKAISTIGDYSKTYSFLKSENGKVGFGDVGKYVKENTMSDTMTDPF